jgi:hypothetical protein
VRPGQTSVGVEPLQESITDAAQQLHLWARERVQDVAAHGVDVPGACGDDGIKPGALSCRICVLTVLGSRVALEKPPSCMRRTTWESDSGGGPRQGTRTPR